MKRIPIKLRKPIILDKSNCCPYDKPYGYIYIVTNEINGNMYIGKHNFDKPYIDLSYVGSGMKLKKAYNKYTVENFTIEILQWIETDNDDLNQAEVYWIDMFDTFRFPQHYNLTPGGDGGYCSEEQRQWMSKNYSGEGNPMSNYKWSEEQRKRQSKLLKGKMSGDKNPMNGKRHTVESLKKMRGRKLTYEQKEHLRKLNLGKTITEETRQKIKLALSDPEVKMKMVNHAKSRTGEKNSNFGNYWSEEKKLESSIKMTGRFSGEKHYWNLRPVVKLDSELNMLNEYKYISEACETGEYTKTGIIDCCRGKQKSHRGFIWMYKENYLAMIGGDAI